MERGTDPSHLGRQEKPARAKDRTCTETLLSLRVSTDGHHIVVRFTTLGADPLRLAPEGAGLDQRLYSGLSRGPTAGTGCLGAAEDKREGEHKRGPPLLKEKFGDSGTG